MTDDLIERADLGSELVRAVWRCEDTFERTLRPRLAGSGSDHLLDALDRDREELRDVMDEIHQRTTGIDPRPAPPRCGHGGGLRRAAQASRSHPSSSEALALR